MTLKKGVTVSDLQQRFGDEKVTLIESPGYILRITIQNIYQLVFRISNNYKSFQLDPIFVFHQQCI